MEQARATCTLWCRALGHDEQTPMTDQHLSTILGSIAEIIAARSSLDDNHVHDITWQAFWRTVHASNPNAYALAEVIALEFQELLRKPNAPLEVLCRYYTMLHDLYRLGSRRDSDVKRFDLNAVIPFAEWLHQNIQTITLRSRKSPTDRLRVGYLCSWAMFTDGNPVADIVHEAINCHATYQNRDIFTYVTIAGNDEYVHALKNTAIRDIRQGYEFGSLVAAVDTVRNDHLDILIADGVGATATYLFSSRVAPIQMYYDYGCPFWSIPQLDWALSAQAENAANLGLPAGRTTKSWSILLPTRRQRLWHESTNRLARLQFPADQFVVGCIVRFSKISKEYINVIKMLLEKRNDIHVVMIGPGESAELTALANDKRFAGRCSIVGGHQDITSYGPALDIFLDTFPHSGGAAAIEVAAHGVPIVSLETADSQRDFRSQRDPRLVAKSVEEYVQLTERLLDEKAWYTESARASMELARTFTDVDRMVANTEIAIEAALTYAKSMDGEHSRMSLAL